MALHGDIRVNHHLIATWEAQNVTGNLTGFNRYDCKIIPAENGIQLRFFSIEHRLEDGALALAAKVMAQAGVE